MKRDELPISSIVLCAGRGRRMQAPTMPKVCFPIAGKPAVVHLLEHLRDLGCAPTILVVGHEAGQVVDRVGPKFPEVLFAYQAELLGTGHAAKQGAKVLRTLGFEGAILVVAGDKVVEARALRKLVDRFRAANADLALVVSPKNRGSHAGRIVQNDAGRVLGCIEHADLAHANKVGATFDFDGYILSPGEVEARCTVVNQAIYLFRAEALFHALDDLARDNVQGEEYLTDAIGVLSRSGKNVAAIPVDDPDDVQAFNSPEELLEIEERFRRKAGIEVAPERAADPRVFKAPEVWAKRLREPDVDVKHLLTSIYGDDPGLCEEKRRHLLEAVELFNEVYGGDEPVAVIRAPGRVNLMGRHVDHRGGRVNLMAIDREQILVARRRTDTTVRAHNAVPEAFGALEFTGGDLLRQVCRFHPDPAKWALFADNTLW